MRQLCRKKWKTYNFALTLQYHIFQRRYIRDCIMLLLSYWTFPFRSHIYHIVTSELSATWLLPFIFFLLHIFLIPKKFLHVIKILCIIRCYFVNPFLLKIHGNNFANFHFVILILFRCHIFSYKYKNVWLIFMFAIVVCTSWYGYTFLLIMKINLRL